ncbi:MAG: ABC transporter substrate-binding protein [Oscillospiraceae bacterium]|nr:ABC transporter substrate-binding protein [Oscillospiraceae bacterium]
MCLAILIIFLKKSNKSNKNFLNIGILQFVEHDALDSVKKGFIDGLTEFGFIDNQNIKIDFKNAQADQSVCNLISNQFVSDKKDLILAIATPAAQSISEATKEIPILVAAVTNPEDSGLVESNKKPNTNVTGVSDLSPIAEQIELIIKLKPETKTIGILFSSSEANSKYQANIAYEKCQKLNLEPKVFNFSNANEIEQVVLSMKNKVDAIYTPTDNMVASNVDIIAKIALQIEVPWVCGETNLVPKGSVGTYGIDYYEIGKLTAKQAAKILNGENKPQEMPIEYLEETKLLLNDKIISKLGIEIPQEFLNIMKLV